MLRAKRANNRVPPINQLHLTAITFVTMIQPMTLSSPQATPTNVLEVSKEPMSTEPKQRQKSGATKEVSSKPARRSRADRRQDSQARILDASLKLLVERGYDRFSLQDVGRLAGCSHELINHYFDNKDGLLAALADHILGGFSTDILQLPKLSPGFEGVARLIRYYAAIADRNFLSFSAYMRIAAEAPFRPTLSPSINKRRSETLSLFVAAIKEAQATGEVRDDIDPEEYADVIYKFVRGHADVRLMNPHAISSNYASADVFIEMLRVAIVNPQEKRAVSNARVAAKRVA